MPRASLAFVVAGCDVLAGDKLGRLGLTLAGARRRDLAVASALEGTSSVWLPAGGYHRGAWRVLAGTGMALAAGSAAPDPRGYDPLSERYSALMRDLTPSQLGESGDITAEEIEEALGLRAPGPRLLLGFYTASGLEEGLHRLGILDTLKRLGFRDLRVAIDSTGLGDRLRRPRATPRGRSTCWWRRSWRSGGSGAIEVLFIHWLSLRNPLATFSDRRPQLPGPGGPRARARAGGRDAPLAAGDPARARRSRLPPVALPPRLHRAPRLRLRRSGEAGALRGDDPRPRGRCPCWRPPTPSPRGASS